MKEMEKRLVSYGLSPNEASVYLFLVKKLEATAFEIARETRIPRTTVYAVLDTLRAQGFVIVTKKNNVQMFSAESVNLLITRAKEKEVLAQTLAPELQNLAGTLLFEPSVRLYTGVDGVRYVLEDVLETMRRTKSKRLLATSQPDLLEFFPRWFPDWLKRRENLGVFTQLILPKRAKGYLVSNELREVRLMPDSFPFDCSMNIYGDGKKLAIFLLGKEPIHAVIVESPAIVTTFKQFFLFTWEMLGERKVL